MLHKKLQHSIAPNFAVFLASILFLGQKYTVKTKKLLSNFLLLKGGHKRSKNKQIFELCLSEGAYKKTACSKTQTETKIYHKEKYIKYN